MPFFAEKQLFRKNDMLVRVIENMTKYSTSATGHITNSATTSPAVLGCKPKPKE